MALGVYICARMGRCQVEKKTDRQKQKTIQTAFTMADTKAALEANVAAPREHNTHKGSWICMRAWSSSS
jgi:hypothetical protein